MSAMDVYWAAPPVSRTLTAATLALSLLTHTGLVSAYWVILYWPAVLQIPPQIWRLATSCILSGPQLGILLDPYFLYTYGSQLEVGSPRFTQPGDFLMYIIFCCTTIIGINYFWTGSTIFTSALILAFVYTSCQDNRGGKFNFMVVNIPAQWAPIAMIFVTFVMNGPYAAQVQTTGLLAAHLYDFLTRLYPEFGGGWNPMITPDFVRRWFAPKVTGVSSRVYGTAITPADRRSQGSSSSASRGPLPDSWGNRGGGRRLGGD
ncbi:MAG: hypothetical protein M1818_000189 [Claussenomyces sp. TS43310]|nr:MAG: hypothetical protein M1818_000189 [Claussenomyces sp. TS43310]